MSRKRRGAGGASGEEGGGISGGERGRGGRQAGHYDFGDFSVGAVAVDWRIGTDTQEDAEANA